MDHLLKIYKEFKNFCKQEIQNYIYKNELDKACFQHDIAYGKYKDLEKRAAFEIANNPKYDGYQRRLASRVYKFFDKKSKGAGQQLANELIWGVDLADMQLISKYNIGIRYLLCALDLFSKYAFVVPLKDKKGSTIVNGFQKTLNNSKRNPNKIWVDQGSEFYNTHFKKLLKDNNIEMYSTHNEGNLSVVAERFIRTLKNKIYKHMTAISKNVYLDVLNDIVDKYNNAYHRTIKMKPIDVKNDFLLNIMKNLMKKILNLK